MSSLLLDRPSDLPDEDRLMPVFSTERAGEPEFTDSRDQIVPQDTSAIGQIYSFTIVHATTKTAAGDGPLVLALVEFPGGKLVTGKIATASTTDLFIGRRVEVLRRVNSSHGIPAGVTFRPL